MGSLTKGRRLQSAGVIGGGAWGTALAQSLCLAGRDVLLWARDLDVVASINARHVNERRLPGIALDHRLGASGDLGEVARRDFVLVAVPAQRMRAIAKRLAPHVDAGTIAVVCAKGYEQATGAAMTAVMASEANILPAVLSGPSFAVDVARGLPTAVTLAARQIEDATRLAAAIGHRHFRIYSSADVTGVEMGGAVKNVLAIAAGVLVGRGYGASAQAALVTRAFHELTAFGRRVGARRETLTGLSCLGDLILTCNSPQSRNFTLGRRLAEGRTLGEALAGAGGTVEGVDTAAVVDRMAGAARPRLEMPIASAVHRIVSGATTLEEAIDDLLSRPQKSEG